MLQTSQYKTQCHDIGALVIYEWGLPWRLAILMRSSAQYITLGDQNLYAKFASDHRNVTAEFPISTGGWPLYLLYLLPSKFRRPYSVDVDILDFTANLK